MAIFTLRRGEKSAIISELVYQAAEGFQEDNTWHVAEEVITAESNIQLLDGAATILHDGTEYPVIVSVLEFERTPGEEDDEPAENEPVCIVDISFAGNLSELATALGLA